MATGANPSLADLQSRHDPLRPGISIGSTDETGTLGAIVRDKTTGRACALTNWHVIGVPAGSDVLQPGPSDGGTAGASRIGSMVRPLIDARGDAAIASIEARQFDARILGPGVAVEQVDMPRHGDIVAKVGRTTGLTRGRVRLQPDVDYLYSSPALRDIIHMQVFAIEPLDAGVSWANGDSGAAWMRCDANGDVTSTMVGLNMSISASTGNAIACFAKTVFDALQIEPIAGGHVPAPAAVSAPAAGPVPSPSVPAPVDLPAGGSAYRVIVDGAPIRERARASAAIVRHCALNEIVAVLGPPADWMMVDIGGKPGPDGYIFHDQLQRV